MKVVMNLKINMEIVCDQNTADKLEERLEQVIADNCFTNNQRRIVDAEITDKEIFSQSIDVLDTLEHRGSAKVVVSPKEVMTKEVRNDNFINLL